MIIKPVVNEFADSDPEKIVEAIQNILSQSLEDKEVEDNLSNA
jgi:RNA binding exosome subunit